MAVPQIMNPDLLDSADLDPALQLLLQKGLGNRNQWFIRIRIITVFQIIADILYQEFRDCDVTDALRCLRRCNNVFSS